MRRHEAGCVLLMCCQSFLARSGYNIVKPLTRATFISKLGAANLPWVLVGTGVLVGLVMQLYRLGVSRLPPWAVQAATLIDVALLLIVFWSAFRAGVPGASVLFYFTGQILGVLLISQFWTLADDIYDGGRRSAYSGSSAAARSSAG